jgi:GntR family transcriptional regulator
MQFLLDKAQKSTLFEQAREQLITALHTGKLRAGDRLPSVRQLAQRNKINLKTAFSIYQRLKEEGYIELRAGSGAYVSDMESADLDQAYCLAVFRMIKSNIAQASHLKLDPRQYADLVCGFVRKSPSISVKLVVIECNREQTNLFTYEISSCLKVPVAPVLLSQLQHPDPQSARILAQADYLVTTDFHFKQVKELAECYKKKTLQLRLNPAFVPRLIAAAHRGKVLMVVSNVDFFPAFQHRLLSIGTAPATLDNITAVSDANLDRVRAVAIGARSVYVSPICDSRVRKAIPEGVEELKFDRLLSEESIEMLEAVMLLHANILPPIAR